jgi:hypothetical protein
MRVQVVQPQVGMTSFAQETNQYPLPAGLPHGTRLTVVERYLGPDVLVRDDFGREFTIAHWQCDCGSIFLVGNEWRAPHDPEFCVWLNRELAKPRPDDLTLAQLQDQLNEGHRSCWFGLRCWVGCRVRKQGRGTRARAGERRDSGVRGRGRI